GDNGLPVITTTVTISGNGAVIERNLAYDCPGGANPDFRLIYVLSPGDLTLHDVALRNGCTGNNGGGVGSLGKVTLEGSAIYSNSASSGGGLFNGAGAAMTITAQSEIYANKALNYGGGLNNTGSLFMEDSAIYTNTTDIGGGGGLYNDGAA